MELIAEVKTLSPFGYKSERSWDFLFDLANRVGDIIAIHTDIRYDGSFDLLEKARSKTTKRILAKGIHENDKLVQRAIDCGADMVLVAGRIPSIHLDKCLIEPLKLSQVYGIPPECKVVWNSRNLFDGSMKTETFAQAKKIHTGWICQASNIKTMNDVYPLVSYGACPADAILVGTHLEEFSKEWLMRW